MERTREVFEWNRKQRSLERIQIDVTGRAISKDSSKNGSKWCTGNNTILIGAINGLESGRVRKRSMESGIIGKTVKRARGWRKVIKVEKGCRLGENSRYFCSQFPAIQPSLLGRCIVLNPATSLLFKAVIYSIQNKLDNQMTNWKKKLCGTLPRRTVPKDCFKERKEIVSGLEGRHPQLRSSEKNGRN